MLTYDRRAPEQLMAALRPSGWAESLVELGRSGQYALDLQLRGFPKREHRATLYVGLTRLFDLCFVESKGFRMKAHPSWKKAGRWSPSWDNYVRYGLGRDQWRDVEAYLERAVPAVAAKYLGEGSIQSALSALGGRRVTVVDREVEITFSNPTEMHRVTGSVSQPLLEATEPTDSAPQWFGSRPKALFEDPCDALAVDTDGSLLAIVLKPANAATSPWAPLQARYHRDLLTRWASGTSRTADIVNAMVHQRAELGLVPHGLPACTSPLRVRAVVAVQRGLSATYLDRMVEVAERLAKAGLGTPRLEICYLNIVGRLEDVGSEHVRA